jgi:myo-inositol-1(or 4)-monophosphatase
LTCINRIVVKQLFKELDKIDYSRSNMTIGTKSDNSFVTNIDYKANDVIEKFFNTLYGESLVNIISEENHNRYNEETKYNIVVDPIDGTENLVHGIPIFGVSVSIFEYGKPLYHTLYFPLLKQYIASDMILNNTTVSLHHKNRLILLSSNTSLEDIQHASTDDNEYRLYGCATYNMYLVLCRKAHMYTNLKANSYDILAGINIAMDVDGLDVFIDDKPYSGEFLFRNKTYKIVMKWR